MLTAQPSTYDKFKSCHMLTAEPSTNDNFLFLLLETTRKTCGQHIRSFSKMKTCHMFTTQPSTYYMFWLIELYGKKLQSVLVTKNSKICFLESSLFFYTISLNNSQINIQIFLYVDGSAVNIWQLSNLSYVDGWVIFWNLNS